MSKNVILVMCLLLGITVGSGIDNTKDVAPAEHSHRSLVRPRIYHGHKKQEIFTTRVQNSTGSHVPYVVLNFSDKEGRDWILDLQLNRDIIPETYFVSYQYQGRHVVTRPPAHDIDLCHYQGFVRGMPNSWVAISTCNGFSGTIFDGNALHEIEPIRNDSDVHVLHHREHLLNNGTSGTENKDILEDHILSPSRSRRYKRSNEEKQDILRGPYNANKESRYVELVLVVDRMTYQQLRSLRAVTQYCREVVNEVYALYMQLNIFVALVGVIVWTERDEISISHDGSVTLENFLNYRRQLTAKHPHDHAQLLTSMHFDGGVIGKAIKDGMCTFKHSGGVCVYQETVRMVATTVAHEMGHSFGMHHDDHCICPDTNACVMAGTSKSHKLATHWSSCSLKQLANGFKLGLDYCLYNKPQRLLNNPICGDGFVQRGEECDCGLPKYCKNPCCNATTCTLISNASCATGECCDMATCKLRRAGVLCRSADRECDLPEYCTGDSEFCPEDVFKLNGEECDDGNAYCYRGMCTSHSKQCQRIWGPTSTNANAQCYEHNSNAGGSWLGHCRHNKLKNEFIPCAKKDVMCGRLNCHHAKGDLQYPLQCVEVGFRKMSNNNVKVECRIVIMDLGADDEDPGLVPDGAKCGNRKVCVKQKCLEVDIVKNVSCPNNCSNVGVCNSKGHCHCDKGLAPPFCSHFGYGGSIDSGPSEDPNANFIISKFLIFFFAVLFMCVVLLSAVIYFRYVKHSTTATSTRNNTSAKLAQLLAPEQPTPSAIAVVKTKNCNPSAISTPTLVSTTSHQHNCSAEITASHTIEFKNVSLVKDIHETTADRKIVRSTRNSYWSHWTRT